MKTILINHPTAGIITLEEIQNDVNVWRKNHHYDTFGFTGLTVQALIDKIIKDSDTIAALKTKNKELTQQLEHYEPFRIQDFPNEYEEQAKRLGL